MSLLERPPLLGEERPKDDDTFPVAAFFSVILVGLGVSQGLLPGLAALVGVMIAFAVLRHPSLGAYLLVFAVPLFSGIKRGVPVPGLRLSEALVVFVAVLVLIPAYRREMPRWERLDWAFLVYVVASVLIPVGHAIARHEAMTLADISPLLLALQFFLLYRTVRCALPERPQRDFAIRLLLLGSLLISAIAFAQQLDLGPARDFVRGITESEALESYGYSVYARATGPFQHWHPLAGYLCVMILLAVALLLDDGQKVLSRRALVLVLLANVTALMLSVTFVSMFGVVMGALLLGYWAGKLVAALKWGVAVVVISMALFGSYIEQRLDAQFAGVTTGQSNPLIPQTVQKRFDVWTQEYFPGMEGRWVTGWGAGMPPDVLWEHTESVYITLLLRGGLPLVAIFALLMWSTYDAARNAGRDPARQAQARAVMALVAVLWVMHFLFPYFTSSGMPQPFWVLTAVVMAGWQTKERPLLKEVV